MKRIYLMGLTLVFLSLVSCGKKEKNEEEAPARSLFKESTQLISVTTKKIQQAKDSTAIDSLIDLFEKNLTDLNFKYPPETDMELTEQENDSIIKLVEKMQTVTKGRLKNLSKHNTGTIPDPNTDSK